MNPDKPRQEIQNFVQILNKSKATVGTLSGNTNAGCVFSAPQNPGEIFTEKTTHQVDKVWVSHSPRQAPVPIGASFWGPSDSLLACLSEQLHGPIQVLAEDFGLGAIEQGYLGYLSAYLEQALGPHVVERPERGLAVEGFAYRTADEAISLYVPDVCYSVRQPIRSLDIAVRLLILAHTSMSQNVKEVRVHPRYKSYASSIQKFFAAHGFNINLCESNDPDATAFDEVEAVTHTSLRGVRIMSGDLISLAGARMLHAKFLGAPDDTAVLSEFARQVSAGVGWLTYSGHHM